MNVTEHHRVYPTIDPNIHFRQKTYRDKVVLVTGASRGIGKDIAHHYALAGASLALVARHHDKLNETKTEILEAASDVKILTFTADVKDWKLAQDVVAETVKHFGRLDILVANAGTSTAMTPGNLLGDKDPVAWWDTFEVNVRGVFNFVRPAMTHLNQSSGYVVAISSGAALMRFANGSDYCVSKHALGRLVEFIPVEYSRVKAFAVHPGVIDTETSQSSGLVFERPDTTELPAATLLYLTSGKIDWMSGRYLSANWDLGELESAWKDKIIEQNALVEKLYVPR